LLRALDTEGPEGKAVATPDARKRAMAKLINTVDGQARQFSNRRSIRVVMDFPVTVFGQNLDGKIFEEKTKTVTVNAHGALVVLKTDIDPQVSAIMGNTKTRTEVQCRIVYRKEIAKDQFEIGLEFASPHPKFWPMNFPPEDWNPSERKKATSSRRPISTSKIRIK
jgi:hypothetical protein